jgi:hypothetical protein
MPRIILVIAIAVVCSGCDIKPYRNTPALQVEDYATCKAGGMVAYLNSVSEVRCAPPEFKP